jgi:asparagine synthase (glutamine-hydrolysing)
MDASLLRQMTEFLAFRGPDAQEIWTAGSVGFGHAMLRTTFEPERQPATLDGRLWITADARVDARDELIRQLESCGRANVRTASDSELLLHAYAVWDERCVEHLLGDFAFAIWDNRARRLFCARDHLGVKPFYYARVGESLIFSNTLDCLRLHPDVSKDLNELAMADFLLFDFLQEADATAFRDIRRLPAAHALLWSDGALHVRRYWELPIEGPLVYRHGSEYVEQFWELLRSAVKDRLPTGGAGVLMSGGLDSTTAAAAAKELLAEESPAAELRAYTRVFDRLISDSERRYAALAADRLGISIEFQSEDDYQLYQGWDQPEQRRPQPYSDLFLAAETDLLRKIATRHRVLLTGFGGDPALSTSLVTHGRTLIRERKFGRLMREFVRYLFLEGRLRRLYLRTRLRILLRRDLRHELFPPWLNPEFSARLELPARWRKRTQQQLADHAVRPSAYEALASPAWPVLFEGADPGTTRVAVEWRHPFFDLRLLGFLLRVPPLPWASDKQLLREAVRGRLPESVRLRRKTPLESDPVLAAVRRGDLRQLDQQALAPELGRYVAWERVTKLTGRECADETWLHLRPVSLNLWFHTGFHAPASASRQRYEDSAGSDLVPRGST